MSYSHSQMNSKNRYIRNNYDRINLTIKSGQKKIWQDIASKEGISLNNFIRIAVEEYISHHYS